MHGLSTLLANLSWQASAIFPDALDISAAISVKKNIKNTKFTISDT